MKKIGLIGLILFYLNMSAFELAHINIRSIVSNSISEFIADNKSLFIELKKQAIKEVINKIHDERLAIQKACKLEKLKHYCPISEVLIKKVPNNLKNKLNQLAEYLCNKFNMKTNDVIIVPTACTDSPETSGGLSMFVELKNGAKKHFIALWNHIFADQDCELFVAAHEMGHLYAGHNEFKSQKSSEFSHLKELEADVLGASISSTSAWGGVKYIIDLFLNGCRHSKSHPHPTKRLLNLIYIYQKVTELELLEGKLEENDVIQQDKMLVKYMQERGIKQFNQQWTNDHAEFFKHLDSNAKRFFKQ